MFTKLLKYRNHYVLHSEVRNVGLKQLSQDTFACELDAVKALSKLSKKFKYHRIDKTEAIKVKLDQVDEKQEKCYKILATYVEDEDKINRERCSAGRFIIATNILESKELSNDSMISEYKAQQSCVSAACR